MTSDQQELLKALSPFLEGRGSRPPADQDLGLLGRVFGARYASTNIVGVVVTVALLFLVVNRFLGPYEYGREAITGTFSLLGLALGYLFGSAGR